jgi:RNA polymerase sigma-70 factor (ECF subfamily)
MTDMATQTSTLLLEGLRDPRNAPAWEEFDARYRPIVTGVGRRVGLSEADAADAAQETMVRFLREYRAGKYERGRGRLRHWLAAMARSCVADARRRAARGRVARGESAIAGLVADTDVDELWDEELRATVLRRAGEMLRRDTALDPRTIRAFELLALGGRSPADVAAELGMNVESVYKARARCLERLREAAAQLSAAYDAD